MNMVVLCLLVVLATAMWPLNRWAVRRGARPEAVGVAISAVAVALGIVLSLAMGSPLLVLPAIGLGAAAGVAYAVGFVLIIFYCLKIGPSGPTVLMNNLGLVWPVTISMLFFAPSAGSTLQWIALACIAATLVMTGTRRAETVPARSASSRWAAWAMAGWVFSGISQGCQFLASRFAPQAPLAFVVSLYAVSLLVLLAVFAARKGQRLTGVEMIAGAGTGVMLTLNISLTIWLLTMMPAVVVLPVTVAGPIVLMLLIGHALLKERLDAAGWLCGALGVAGMLLLTLTWRSPSP